jgi:Lon protease-like protein
MIAMIQPRTAGLVPELYDVGCVGHIQHVEALDDGRFNLVLEGISRFRMLGELDVTTPFSAGRGRGGGRRAGWGH